MFYEEIRTKQGLSYIPICSLSSLYNSKFILMAMSLGTNAVVVTRVHCIARHTMTVRKVMYAVFFTIYRSAIKVVVPRGKGVTALFYRHKKLKKPQVLFSETSAKEWT